MRRINIAAALALLPVSGAAVAAETITYGYDARGRLVKVTRAGTSNVAATTDYAYDKADNRVAKTVSGASPPPYPSSSFAISNASATEGGDVFFTVTRSGSTSASHMISYGPRDGSAWYGHDYMLGSGTISFAPGQVSAIITASTVEDAVAESIEDFWLDIADVTGGATITTGTASGFIHDDDAVPGPSSFAVGHASANEGGNLVFTVTRSGSTSGSHTISYGPRDGNAWYGHDYILGSGTVIFAPGQTSATITASTVQDNVAEPLENMWLDISDVTGGATITAGTASGAIHDDDS